MLVQVSSSFRNSSTRWFDITSHQEGVYEHDSWGGLWTATTAEAFAADAVRMYTSTEEQWGLWQARGLQLLQKLYQKEERLQTIRVGNGFG